MPAQFSVSQHVLVANFIPHLQAKNATYIPKGQTLPYYYQNFFEEGGRGIVFLILPWKDRKKENKISSIIIIVSTSDVLPFAYPAQLGRLNKAKVKAMELIDQLEATRRGPYSGGFGRISFTGDTDIALALRTIVFPTSVRYDTMYSYKDKSTRQDWVAHLQAGAGIVADSDPANEHSECENKDAGLARAIDLAESSFIEK
ncbi:unnamed protein product [Fraxinus pennsylvanica]|uniref:Chorismate-utilising enzyme C-terminal domain-containing protein n=1 Tax=Fraxinus pennsylvanica TaxID=56036 RepID=A0AAD1YXU3_9LAMI|nr:unnamed protein product [Fraxinus pennsylvanica]